MKITDKKQINNFAYIMALTYMASYLTRINYGAVISEMESATNISRSLLSMSVTGSFITYGVGQVVSGFFGDRFSPKNLVSIGFVVTILMNLLIPLCSGSYQMLFVWCINGFAQSFMWPPMVKLMTCALCEDDYKRSIVKVSWGSSLGTVAVYFSSSVIIMFSSWKTVFIFSALCAMIILVIWQKKVPDLREDIQKIAKLDTEQSSVKVLFAPIMIMIMLAIILQGALRDGITTWMPTYISDTYNMDNSISILTGVIMPLFGILSFNITSYIYNNKLKNPILCAASVFLAGVISALGIIIFTGTNAFLSVLFTALLTGCMHGVNLILICMIPPYFKRFGNVSTVSGVLNACTYIGSALSTYLIALLSEKFGWNFTLMVWLGIAIVGTSICFICVKPWNNKMEITK